MRDPRVAPHEGAQVVKQSHCQRVQRIGVVKKGKYHLN
jgi:hypothetical protein